MPRDREAALKRYWLFFSGSGEVLEPEVLPLALPEPLAEPVADLSVLDELLLLGEVVEDEPPEAEPDGLDGGVVALEDDEPEPDGLVELLPLMPEDELEPG